MEEEEYDEVEWDLFITKTSLKCLCIGLILILVTTLVDGIIILPILFMRILYGIEIVITALSGIAFAILCYCIISTCYNDWHYEKEVAKHIMKKHNKKKDEI